MTTSPSPAAVSSVSVGDPPPEQLATTSAPNPAYLQLRSLQAERAAAVSALQSRKADLAAQVDAMTSKQVAEPGLAAEQDQGPALDQDHAEDADQVYVKLNADG